MENTYQYSQLLGAKPLDEKPMISMGLNQLERCEMALTKLLMPDFNTGGIPAFRGLKDAYAHFTGDTDVSGFLNPKKISGDLRSCQDFDSGSFSHALENAMNRYISRSYKEFPFHEEILISQKNTVTDLRKIHSIQLGYFGELPDVDTETADYADIAPYGDTEANYELSKKGAIVWVTNKHIINDDINVIKAMTQRLSRAARNAHAKYVWNFYINNGLCPDGMAWFAAEHGNLASAALDILPMVTAIKALANMTEPGPSTEKLGMDLATFNWNLVVPGDMWDTAVKKNQCDATYTANDLTTKDPNPCQKLFGERNERIVTCPFLADANDWGIIRGREDVPIVEMSYFNGHEEPQLFLSWGPSRAGQTMNNQIFNRDKLGYKIRHEYGGALADYRGGYKSIVP